MEELQLSLKFSIFVASNRAIWAHSDYVLHQWIHGYALYQLLMPIESLNLAEFIASNAPQYGGVIDWARHQEVGIAGPTEVHNVADMASELSRVAPLYDLFSFAKFSWNQLQSPNYHHLVIRPWSQILPTWREPDDVYSGGMASLQIVSVLWVPFDRPVITAIAPKLIALAQLCILRH